MRILLIGHAGQVAYELKRSLACLGETINLGRASHPPLDLADPASLRATVRSVRPDLIVNAAAYTAVDKAEQEPELAHQINGEACGLLAEEALAIGAGLLHYSTDYVFPGDAGTPYLEDDVTGPLGRYGLSKLSGEQAIRQSGVQHLILRTAWVYGRRGQNFLLTMLRLMKERDSLSIVADQHGAPTWSRMIAEATALMIGQCLHDGVFQPGDKAGTYHLTAGGETTWFGFAEKIRTLAIARGLLDASCASLQPIPTSAYPTPAKRPAYSVLSNEKLARQFGIVMPDWAEALDLCLTD